MNFQEEKIYLKNHDLNLSYKISNKNGSIPLIGIHGWLDNANSFDLMTPYLSPQIKFYALDLCGHGKSDHNKTGVDYTLVSCIQQIIDFASSLGLEYFHLVGHSLGAVLASILAGILPPEKLKTLTLIEGVGPITYPSEELPQRMLHNLKIKSRKIISQKKMYSSKEEAALQRSKKTNFSYDFSLLLSERGLKKLEDGKYTWSTDQKLLVPSAHPFTEEQVSAFLKRILCPTLSIWGEDPPILPQETINKRLKLLKYREIKTYKGGHHVHLDSPKDVAQAINSHLRAV